MQWFFIYFSIEFLIGRIVLGALTNSGLMKVTREIFEKDNYHFICEYPDNKFIEKTVSYTCVIEVVDNSIKYKKV